MKYMPWILIAGCVATGLGSTIASAQSATPAAAQAAMPAASTRSGADTPDPALMAAAAQLIDVLLPPTQRDATMAAMVSAQMQTVVGQLLNQPTLKAALEREPGARPILERFIMRQQNLAAADLTENLPGLIEAMTLAYARRFTLSQLSDMTEFFRSPTGQAYVAQSTTIMTDPAIAAWQARTMATNMARMPDEVARLMRDLETAGIRSDRNGN
jgi:hypothetical protein